MRTDRRVGMSGSGRARLSVLAMLAASVSVPALAQEAAGSGASQGASDTGATALTDPQTTPGAVPARGAKQSIAPTRRPQVAASSARTASAMSTSAAASSSGTFSSPPDFASLAAPTFQSVDANGVDLLSGSFNISSPVLSMGDKAHGLEFALSWNGRAWLPPVPSIWQNPDTTTSSYTVTLDGETAVFEPTGTLITQMPAGDTFANPYDQYGYRIFSVIAFDQIKPNVGGRLICRYPLSESGRLRTPMPYDCRFVSREGKAVYFRASDFTRIDEDNNLIERGDDASFFRAFSNIYMFPYLKAERDSTYSTAYVAGTNLTNNPNPGPDESWNKGRIVEQAANGYSVYSYDEFYAATATFTMTNLSSDVGSRTERKLVISTPGLYDGTASTIDPRTASYLSPKSTTQTITDPAGRRWQYTFDSAGNMTKVVTPAGRVTSLTYDGERRVTSLTNGAGTWRYGYTASNGAASSTTVATDPANAQRKVARVKKDGPVATVTDELGRVTSYGYDGTDRVTKITYPESDSTQYTYDSVGNVVQQTRNPRPAVGGTALVTKATYSTDCGTGYRPLVACYRPSALTDPKGAVTNYTYDVNAQPTAITLPAAASGGVRPQTRYAYQDLPEFWYSGGAVIGGTSSQGITLKSLPLLATVSVCQTGASCAGTADEVVTQYGYATGYVAGSGGNNMLPLSSTTKTGAGTVLTSASQSYDLTGNVLTVDGPLAGTGDTVTNRYDAARQVTGVIGPDPDGTGSRLPIAERRTYNLDGQVTLAETGNVASAAASSWSGFTVQQRTATTYDGAGRPVTVATGGASTVEGVTQTEYSQAGYPLCVTTRMDRTSFPAIGSSGAMTGGSLPGSACTADTGGSEPDRIVKTARDAAGEVTKTVTAYGTSAASDEVTSAYTPNGEVDYVTDANGNRTDYSYDGFDRLVKTNYPSKTLGAGAASTSDYEQLTLDANGNVVSRRQRDGQTIGYSYDALNRLTLLNLAADEGTDTDISYTYDLLGRLVTSRNTKGHLTNYGYDGVGRVLTEQTTYGKTKTSTYDAAGRRTRLTWPDGFFVDYAYDTTGNMLQIRENGATSGLGLLASFAYDNLGRRTKLTRGNGTSTSYTYDAVSRLASLKQDLAGTASDVTTSFSYNAADQIAASTRSNDAYAWAGGINTDRAYTSNGLNQYTQSGTVALGYDAKGNLTSSGTTSYAYGQLNQLRSAAGGLLYYDPAGRLDMVYDDKENQTFDYDGSNLVTEGRFQQTGIARRYVFGPGTDEPLVWYEIGDAVPRRWLHADERGSIVAVTNDAGGVVGVNTYDEHGIPASTNIGRFQYTGQAWLPAQGLYYYKARMYSPTLGRFLQTDPIGYADGLNWYRYAGNDPVNNTDPTGTYQSCIGDIANIYWSPDLHSSSTSNVRCTDINFDMPTRQAALPPLQPTPGSAAKKANEGKKVSQKDLADAQKLLIELCSKEQTSPQCVLAKQNYKKLFAAFNQQNPLPEGTGPLPPSQYEQAKKYTVDSVGCATGVATGGALRGVLGKVGGVLTLDSCINMVRNGMGN